MGVVVEGAPSTSNDGKNRVLRAFQQQELRTDATMSMQDVAIIVRQLAPELFGTMKPSDAVAQLFGGVKRERVTYQEFIDCLYGDSTTNRVQAVTADTSPLLPDVELCSTSPSIVEGTSGTPLEETEVEVEAEVIGEEADRVGGASIGDDQEASVLLGRLGDMLRKCMSVDAPGGARDYVLNHIVPILEATAELLFTDRPDDIDAHLAGWHLERCVASEGAHSAALRAASTAFRRWQGQEPMSPSSPCSPPGKWTIASPRRHCSPSAGPRSPSDEGRVSTETTMSPTPLPGLADALPGDPERGISVHFLRSGFLADLQDAGLDQSCTIREAEESVILARGEHALCPRDGRAGSSYVDTVHGDDNVGLAEFVFSYWSGYRVMDIVDTLSTFCHDRDLDPCSTFVWMCCFCTNHHRLKEARVSGDGGSTEDAREACLQRVRDIPNFLAMVAPWEDLEYTKRAWCLFELSSAIASKRKISVLLPSKDRQAFSEALLDGNHRPLLDALAEICIEDAVAFQDEDKAWILSSIDAEAEDYDASPAIAATNHALRSCLQGAMVDMGACALEVFLSQGRNVSCRTICDISQQIINSRPDLPRARALLEAGLAHGPREGMYFAEALRLLGDTFYWTGDNTTALRHYGRSRSAFEAAGGTTNPNYASLLRNMGFAHSDAGRLRKALRHYLEAKAVYEELGVFSCSGYARLLRSIGVVQGRQGDVDAAHQSFVEARAAYEAAGANSGPGYADLLQNIGLLQAQNGETEDALQSYEEARAAFQAAGAVTDPRYATLLLNIGEAQAEQGDIEAALDRYWEASEA